MPETLFFDRLLLPSGWVSNARISVEAGRIAALSADQRSEPGEERHSCGLPGLPNLHSHAFQRAIAGLTERRGNTADSFWTWRDLMYRFVGRMTPDDLHAVASMAYVEMLETGFTRVGEFHYLHHDVGGVHFADIAEMSAAIAGAAGNSGIGLTLLPVLYSYSGFGALPPSAAQARFVCSIDEFARIFEGAKRATSTLPDAIVGVAPHSLRAVAPEQLGVMASLAQERPIHIHIAEQVKEVEDCFAWSGARPVAWLLDNAAVDNRWCLVHATHIDRDETTSLARSGAVAGLCPITEANLGDGLFPAEAFLGVGGCFGIGSDSNVRIDTSEELRLLEYGQRLGARSRNVLALDAGHSTGFEMYQRAVSGGAQALGVDGGLVVGASADFISLDLDHPAFAICDDPTIVDALVFAAGSHAIDCVWRHGRKLVAGGRHKDRPEIARRYRATVTRLIE